MGARRIRIAVVAIALVAVTSPTVGVRAGPGAQAVEPAQPKNIILMVGDGMGPAHVDLARRFVGGPLAMDLLDAAPGSMAHDNIDGEVTDSAASATAFATGHKTVNGAMSVDRDGTPMETAWERAEASGKATGIVSSVFLIDATPGVWAAHSADRYAYSSIAKQQAIGSGTWEGRLDGAEVLMGAGAMYYRPQGANGTGDVNLIDELVDRGYQFVRKTSELERADPARRLLGFFGGAMMTYALDRPLKKGLTEPTLAQMTTKALEVVGRDEDGFFIVVEGGAIDWAAHKEDAAGTLREVLAFDAAVDVARRYADSHPDTLLIVVADHETGGLSLGAGPNLAFLGGVRATVDTIWGAVEGGLTIDAAMKTYAGIGGAWPALTTRERDAIRACGDPLGIADVLNARAGIGWGWSGCEGAHHTSTKVLVFASGPGAAQFDGTALDNTDIGKALFAALPLP